MAAAAELTALGRCWFWLLLGLQAISVYGAQLSSEACRELGFSSNLLCSSCNLLGQFNLNQLDPFCRQCCQEEAQLETRKLLSGVISQNSSGDCKSSCIEHQSSPDYSWDRERKSGTRKKMSANAIYFTRLLANGLEMPVASYVRGSDPVLKLLDDNGNIAEELSILKWNTDSVEEFLSEKLERL